MRRTRARAAAGAVIAAAILMAMTGCDLYAPQETKYITEASDGVSGTVGSVFVGNAVIVSNAGRVGNLVVTLINQGSSSADVQIAYGSSPQNMTTIPLEPAETKQLGTSDGTLVYFTELDAIPGSLANVGFTAGSDAVSLQVPVLAGDLPPYNTLTPTPSPLPSP